MDELKKPEEDENELEVETEVKDEKKAPAHKTHDDDSLIDVRVNNPLKRITDLLEEIKKQKAFSFTLKGSLGIMGVALTLSLIGVFGTNYALCDKGVQTKIGSLRALSVIEEEEDSIWNRIKNINNYFTGLITGKKVEERIEKRTVLILSGNNTIQITKGKDVSLVPFRDKHVIVTGYYNSCSERLKVNTQSEIELLTQQNN